MPPIHSLASLTSDPSGQTTVKAELGTVPGDHEEMSHRLAQNVAQGVAVQRTNQAAVANHTASNTGVRAQDRATLAAASRNIPKLIGF